MKTVFGTGWFCAGVVGDVPNAGDFVSFEIGDEPLMIVRGKDDVIRVMTRVCQHRAMMVVDGRGNAKRFSCPYHAWTYALDGALMGAPLMDGAPTFDKAKCSLPTLKVELWNGFIFATFAENPPPLAGELAGLTNRLEPFEMDVWNTRPLFLEVINANWKLIVENAAESYHHIGAHRETLQRYDPGQNSRVGDVSARYATHHNFNAGFDMEQLASKTHVTPEEHAKFYEHNNPISSVFPNLTFAVGEGGGLLAIVYPISVDKCVFRLWVANHPTKENERQKRRAAESDPDAFILAFNEEDVVMAAGLTRATKSRFAKGGPLSLIEAPIQAFYDYVRSQVDPA